MMKNSLLTLFCILSQLGTAQNLPDLTLTNLNITNPSVPQGQVLYYKFDLKNRGTGNAVGGFSVKAYFSKDASLSADDVQEGTMPTANFGAGSSALQVKGTATMRNPIGAGNYYLILKVDADNYIAESNENNNLLVSSLIIVTPAYSCRSQDSLELVRLYQATNGANWTNKWNLNTPIHTWFGVTLTAQGCVQNLRLDENNLNGTLPNLNLQKLDTVFLSNNSLRGNLPAFQLPLVQLLLLRNNQFSGSIPYLNCPNLKVLVVSGNQFTGSIPDLSLNCPLMYFMDFSYNPLTGVIPNFKMPDLTGLFVGTAQITGPLPKFNLPKLTVLGLSNNQITGTIPNFNLPSLAYLFLSFNRLSGTIPALNIPNAERIFLDNNQFTGSIPDFNFPPTCTLRLSSNQLSGCIPISLKKYCANLEMTNNPKLLNQNFATFCDGNWGACTQNIPDLTVANLNLTQNTVQQGQILNYKFDLTKMGIDTALGSFKIKAYISTDNVLNFYNIPNEMISINNVNLGVVPLQVSGASTMPNSIEIGRYYLILKVDAEGQIAETNERNNTIVSLPFYITPSLSSDRSRDSLQLVRLYHSTNGASWIRKWNLNTPINTWYGIGLDINGCVQKVEMVANNLIGSLPNLNLPKLSLLILTHNQLQGDIPAFQLPNLESLALSNNQLTGSIPNFNFPATCNIRLNSNQLMGCIPNSLKKYCPNGVEMRNNPELANQDFATFCSENIGKCPPTRNNYCVSKGDRPWSEWIGGVKFSNLNNPNTKQGYTDFTGETATVLRGSSYSFTLTQGYSWAGDPSNATAQWRVWIDYNQNNRFDADELAASGTRTTSTARITIPSTAQLGNTVMRVSFKKTGAPTACEVFEKGEVEDYTVNIEKRRALEKVQNIDNQLVTNFNIFPNPAQGEVFLDLKDFENQKVEISISDVAGKAIWNQTLEKATASPHRLDVSKLKNGAYLIHIQSVAKGSVMSKLYIL